MVTNNFLCPELVVASDDEVSAFLKKFGITKENLPLIHATDVSVLNLKVSVGGVVKSLRKSPITGEVTPYYRLVIE